MDRVRPHFFHAWRDRHRNRILEDVWLRVYAAKYAAICEQVAGDDKPLFTHNRAATYANEAMHQMMLVLDED